MSMLERQWNARIVGPRDLKISGRKTKKSEKKNDSLHRHFLASSNEWSMMIFVVNLQSSSSLWIFPELPSEVYR